MTDEKEPTPRPASGGGSSKEEVALELMRFIASTTGVGKPTGGAGFTGGKAPKSAEEQIDALLALYDRCKSAVGGK
jgi:hypothetical protein